MTGVLLGGAARIGLLPGAAIAFTMHITELPASPRAARTPPCSHTSLVQQAETFKRAVAMLSSENEVLKGERRRNNL